jgi:hypothetical protein
MIAAPYLATGSLASSVKTHSIDDCTRCDRRGRVCLLRQCFQRAAGTIALEFPVLSCYVSLSRRRLRSSRRRVPAWRSQSPGRFPAAEPAQHVGETAARWVGRASGAADWHQRWRRQLTSSVQSSWGVDLAGSRQQGCAENDAAKRPPQMSDGDQSHVRYDCVCSSLCLATFDHSHRNPR